MSKPVPVYVVGTGYVGLVLATCLARLGQCQVTCIDTDEQKIHQLKQGIPTISEPKLKHELQLAMTAERITFRSDMPALPPDCVVFIAVGTPRSKTGSADTQYVEAACKQVAKKMTGRCAVVIKSTVPVGTSARCRALMTKITKQTVAMISNPEFLAEGRAVTDFLNPSRIVLGYDGYSDWALTLVRSCYATFRSQRVPFIVTNNETAELAKYACNAMLATRISFMNELARLCDYTRRADVEHIREIMGLDSRIGSKFLRAGPGYGGSCFPKDVVAYEAMFRGLGGGSFIMPGVRAVNYAQVNVITEKVRDAVGGEVAGKRIAVLGVAFKSGTGDTRESCSVSLIDALSAQGASIVACDPVASLPDVEMAPDEVAACSGADVVVLMTDWPAYVFMAPTLIGEAMNQRVIVDARNVLDREQFACAGFRVISIGRPEVK